MVQALGANKEIKKTMKYTGVKLRSIKPTEFNNESGDPVRVECEFIYLRTSFE